MVFIFIQARSASKRLPGKIFEPIGEKALLEWVFNSARLAAERLNEDGIRTEVKVIGPFEDMELKSFCERHLIPAEFPEVHPDDLIARYLEAGKKLGATIIVRLTGDCWQAHPTVIEETVKRMHEDKLDYCSNTIHRSFYEGLDCQAVSMKGLEWLSNFQKDQREHPFIFFDANERDRKAFEGAGFKYAELINSRAEWTVRTSVDSPEDLELARRIHDQREATRKLMEQQKRDAS